MGHCNDIKTLKFGTPNKFKKKRTHTRQVHFLFDFSTTHKSSLLMENYPKNCHNDPKWNIFLEVHDATLSDICKIATTVTTHTHTQKKKV